MELIIYIGVFSVVAVVMVQFFLASLRGLDLANAKYEVSQNIRFATEKIKQTVFDASAVSTSGSCPLNTLNATSTSNATSSIFVNASGTLEFSDASGTVDLTTGQVIATTTATCLFTIISNPAPAKPTVQTSLKIVYNNQSRTDLSQVADTQQFTTSLR